MAVFLAGPAAAMDVQVIEDQIIMSGRIDTGELPRLWEIAEADKRAKAIRTVVLRDSAGGDLRTSLQAADFIRRQGWNTAVSGYCFSGCALMFLGGRERGFTDDKAAARPQLGFHGAYHVATAIAGTQRFEPGSVSAWHTGEARRWIQRGTDGKISQAMLDRFEQLAQSDFIHFFNPAQLPRKGQVSIFVCPIVKEGGRKCEPIAGTDVFREGIANSEVLIGSNDRR
jgi:hypothetical protein